jgi:hypothetical protein
MLFPMRSWPPSPRSWTYRWRSEPKVSFSIAPMTSLEIRAPITYLARPGDGPRGTIARGGIGIGTLRALSVETRSLAALALSGEALAAAVGFLSGRAS